MGGAWNCPRFSAVQFCSIRTLPDLKLGHTTKSPARGQAEPAYRTDIARKAGPYRTARPNLTELQLLLRGFSYLAEVIFAIKPSNGLNVCLAKSV